MVNKPISEIKRLNLIRIMGEKRLNNTELSKLLGVSKPRVTSILQEGGEGKRGIGDKALDKLCDVLKVSRSEFLQDATEEDLSTGNKESYVPLSEAQIVDCLVLILKSGNKKASEAITKNIETFKITVDQEKEIIQLRERVKELEAKLEIVLKTDSSPVSIVPQTTSPLPYGKKAVGGDM